MVSQIPLSLNAERTYSVARAVYDASRRRGEILEMIKLEKLVYLSHGWCLAVLGEPLVTETFQVQQFGPGLGSLRTLKRRYGNDPLPFDDGDAIFGGRCIPYGDEIRALEVLVEVMKRYGCYTGWKISAISRMGGGAYERAVLAGESYLRDTEIRSDFVQLALAGRKNEAA